MYEYKDKLLVRTGNGFEIVTMTLTEDGGYAITSTGKKYNSRPKGATPVTFKQLVVRNNLAAGDVFPKVGTDEVGDKQ